MNTTPSRPRHAHPSLDWRNRLLRVFAAFLAMAMLASAHTRAASADPCRIIIGDPTPPVCGTAVPDLLSMEALLGATGNGLYLATTAQIQSLQVLEQAAVSATIRDHRLAAGDADAVQSWGRGDAQAELWALIVQAIQAPAASRSTDQQNAVAWMTTVFQREGVRSADDAGREYVTWAGLDQTQYQHLLDTNAGQDAITAFLANNNLPPSGYCAYRSPAPYQSEYTGWDVQTCFTPCTSAAGCIPFPPDYNQFVKWGAAQANGTTLNTPGFAQQASNISQGEALGGTFAAATVLGVAIGTNTALAGALAGSAFQVAIFPFAGGVVESSVSAALAAEAAAGEAAGEAAAAAAEAAADVAAAAAETAGSIAAASVGFIVAIAIAGIAVGVIYLINIINALNLPGQLASLIVGAATPPVLDATLLGDATQIQGLYGLFVGATLPAPRFATCNNAIGIIISGGAARPTPRPCLNAPAIPAPANSDPLFAIQAKGATTTTYSTSISWKDAAAGVSTTARLSETWFIDQVSAPGLPATTLQTLRIHYTDWSGNEQYAWLLGDPAAGYKFLAIAESGASLNPSTCLADKTCSYSSTIDYVGTDGADYAASVLLTLPSVAPTTSANPVEASPVTFTANGSSPLGLPLTYQWQFEQPSSSIIIVIGGGVSYDYTAPVSGPAASYTWTTSGTFHVQLTATDSAGKQTVDTFTVTVGDVGPTLTLYPPPGPLGCIALCNTYTVPLGSVTTLAGTVGHAGAADAETVVVDWGDGTAHDTTGIGGGIVNLASNLTLTATSPTLVTLSDTHTYAKAGSYSATVTATDQGGGTATRIVTEIAQAPQSIAFASIPDHTYGDAPFAISATGGGSGKAITFASTTLAVCGLSAPTSGSDSSGNGTGGATVTLLAAGTCTITADQGGVSNTAGTAIYTPAPQASQSFAAQQASQAITFGALPNHLLGDAPVAVSATGGRFGQPHHIHREPG